MKKEYPDWVGKKIFTNEKGYDWFLDEDLTRYARGGKTNGYRCYLIGKDGAVLERVLVDRNNKPVYSSQKAEDIVIKLDILNIK